MTSVYGGVEETMWVFRNCRNYGHIGDFGINPILLSFLFVVDIAVFLCTMHL